VIELVVQVFPYSENDYLLRYYGCLRETKSSRHVKAPPVPVPHNLPVWVDSQNPEQCVSDDVFTHVHRPSTSSRPYILWGQVGGRFTN
jgi:hypothetical protein